LPIWVYVYNQPLPPGARGPIDRWDGRRRAPVRSAVAAETGPAGTTGPTHTGGA
jgi:hypothetical protein